MRRIVTNLLKPGLFDFATDVAVHLPPAVLAAALGISSADVYLLQPWSVAMVKYWEFHHEPDTVANAENAAREIGSYVTNLVGIRRTGGGDDVISHLISAGLSDHEIVVMAVLLLNAGHETTVHLLGNAVLALLEQRAAWRQLVADPSLAPAATEELLRYDTSIQTFPRRILQEAEIGGQTLAAGADIRLVLGSANHDADVFSHPDELNLTRQPNPHLSFGFGIHTCLGAPLARIEIAETLAVLAQERPELELAGEPLRRPGFQVRGLESLPLR
ncbi:MAG: cytochrome P450 [Chloroflexota bacterium]